MVTSFPYLVLSHFQTDPETPTAEVLLSPPFILSTSISSSGVLAVGTADGKLWIGAGGEKRPKKKRSRRWEGLREDQTIMVKVAEGPVVGMYVKILYEISPGFIRHDHLAHGLAKTLWFHAPSSEWFRSINYSM